MEKYPSWLKGLPWKGSRSLIAARGFKSLLLRLLKIIQQSSGENPENLFQKVLDKVRKLR